MKHTAIVRYETYSEGRGAQGALAHTDWRLVFF